MAQAQVLPKVDLNVSTIVSITRGMTCAETVWEVFKSDIREFYRVYHGPLPFARQFLRGDEIAQASMVRQFMCMLDEAGIDHVSLT